MSRQEGQPFEELSDYYKTAALDGLNMLQPTVKIAAATLWSHRNHMVELWSLFPQSLRMGL